MIKNYKLIDKRKVGSNTLHVYGSKEHPLFAIKDICSIIRQPIDVVYKWLDDCKEGEYFTAKANGVSSVVWFITVIGLSDLFRNHGDVIGSDYIDIIHKAIPEMAVCPRKITDGELADNAVLSFYCDMLGVDVRVVHDSGVPYFICDDMVESLGYRGVNSMLHQADPEDRKYFFIDETRCSAVNESGLFSILLGSKHKDARTFKKWVTSSVLPSLRKHGAYAASDLLDNPDLMIQVLEQLKKERTNNATLNKSLQLQAKTIAELEPKAEYYDKVLSSENAVPISVIAKDYGKSAIWLNKKLHELKVQYRRGNMWVLYQRYADKGYTTTRTHYVEFEDGRVEARTDMVWTQAGREFIWKLLGAKGICMTINNS